ncbi:PREDICTED: mRNA decay activator protein ZFP36-like [Lupinus angustifolius]|uniref:mRNA decay activator protein ZFP36-like n=1 Tax=Lupinus angustifolius TaxID=3871 RepID=UPI00092E28B6|nr:PREDICTED: mRNA decay activator protein ZFP36-like [Lupinus angustifolius]
MESQSQKRFKLSSPSSSTFTNPIPNHALSVEDAHDFYKTQLCRKFSEGFCTFGSQCKYAHGIAELKPRRQQQQQQQNQLCRMFLHNKQCSYGHNCRFIHVNANQNISHDGSQPQLEKLDGYSSAKCTTMQTSNAAANVSTGSLQKNEPSPYIYHREHPQLHPAKCRVMQTSTAATNASATSSLHKYKENGVTKFIFKGNNLQKINGIYGDWI